MSVEQEEVESSLRYLAQPHGSWHSALPQPSAEHAHLNAEMCWRPCIYNQAQTLVSFDRDLL